MYRAQSMQLADRSGLRVLRTVSVKAKPYHSWSTQAQEAEWRSPPPAPAISTAGIKVCQSSGYVAETLRMLGQLAIGRPELLATASCVTACCMQEPAITDDAVLRRLCRCRPRQALRAPNPMHGAHEDATPGSSQHCSICWGRGSWVLTHIAPARAERQAVRRSANLVLMQEECRTRLPMRGGMAEGLAARLHAVQTVSQAGDHHGDGQLQGTLRSRHDLHPHGHFTVAIPPQLCEAHRAARQDRQTDSRRWLGTTRFRMFSH